MIRDICGYLQIQNAEQLVRAKATPKRQKHLTLRILLTHTCNLVSLLRLENCISIEHACVNLVVMKQLLVLIPLQLLLLLLIRKKISLTNDGRSNLKLNMHFFDYNSTLHTEHFIWIYKCSSPIYFPFEKLEILGDHGKAHRLKRSIFHQA